MLVIGSDHGGYTLKEAIKVHLTNRGIRVLDVGCKGETCDYPDIAHAACEKIQSGEAECGILCCGTGIGISIAANKYRGIRAALVAEPFSAKLAKEHNNANILCLGGRTTGENLAIDCVDAWLDAAFLEKHHTARVFKIHRPEEE